MFNKVCFGKQFMYNRFGKVVVEIPVEYFEYEANLDFFFLVARNISEQMLEAILRTFSIVNL